MPAEAEKGKDRKKVWSIVKLLPQGAKHNLVHYCTKWKAECNSAPASASFSSATGRLWYWGHRLQ